MSKTQRELKAMRQAQREEAAARQRARDRRNLMIIGGGVVVLALAIIVVAQILNHASQVASANHIKFRAVATLVGQQVKDEGRNHIDPSTTATYALYPPSSGPHYNAQGIAPVTWRTIGTLAEGQYIHNLEHGGIVVLYNCPSGSDCTSLRNQLENYVNNLVPVEPQFNEMKIVLSPYSRGMQKKIALVAWDYVQFLDTYDQNAITTFYESHVDKGPEAVP
ncbi:MAG: DUF3105 domain-containing protein [Candidatus Dormibacteraeota bacterium]|nr:DUF3105 domain-containing protein [Candidatus Dormibacteraeota bacterium]